MNALATKSKSANQALLALVVSTLAACAGPQNSQTANHSADYTKDLDAWRCTNHALPLALKGDDNALRACFLSAYVRVSEPLLGGEDLEQMSRNFSTMLDTLGDAKFARALLLCRPEVRAATGWFLKHAAGLPNSPVTRRIIEAAPTIDWPIDKAARTNAPA